jgi:hypothetical protein
MPVTLHFTNESSAWKYLIPALFNFDESDFSWETCRFSQGFLLASQQLLKEGQQIFTAVKPGCEPYVEKWLKLYGAPSSNIVIYCWGTADEPLIEALPYIQVPPLPDDLNGFLLHLRSRYPSRSLKSLLEERAVPLRDRIRLRSVLSPELTSALAKQLDRAAPILLAPPPTPPRPNQTTNKPPQPDHNQTTTSATDQPKPSNADDFYLEKLTVQLPPKTIDQEEQPPYNIEDVLWEPEPPEDLPHWSIGFADNPHLPILQHIDEFGAINEGEIFAMLNNARIIRSFTAKIDVYNQLLPFEIRIQSTANGNRYAKLVSQS